MGCQRLGIEIRVSLDTIFKIENGVTQARGASIDKIVQAFAAGGVEFSDNQGVRWIVRR